MRRLQMRHGGDEAGDLGTQLGEVRILGLERSAKFTNLENSGKYSKQKIK